MIPLEPALAVVDMKIGERRVPLETLPVREAAKRTLGADQQSLLDLPPFDKSAVDGYAILADDECEEYRLAEVVAAGQINAVMVSKKTGKPVKIPDEFRKAIQEYEEQSVTVGREPKPQKSFGGNIIHQYCSKEKKDET